MALRASDRDPSADPAVDFYRFANGGWLDGNEIPPGYDPEIVWDGLRLLPFALAVHVGAENPEAPLSAREIAAYEAQGVPYHALRDGDVLVVEDAQHAVLS